MIRTQIQLKEKQMQMLKRLATDRGVSVAALIRNSVDLFVHTAELVDEDEHRRRALGVVGRFRSGRSDLAVEHDRYLQDAYNP